MTNPNDPRLTITVNRQDFSYSPNNKRIKRGQCVKFILGDRDSATVTFRDQITFQDRHGNMPSSIKLDRDQPHVEMQIAERTTDNCHCFTAPEVPSLARGGDDNGGTMVGDVDVEPRLPNETRSPPRKQGQRATGGQRALARR